MSPATDIDRTVAITGMACLFPGAPDLDAYWRNILGKVESISDPPPESWDPEVYYDPSFADVDRTYCRRGGYLGPLARFDPLSLGIPPVAVGGEPDQWLALAVARDALRDAGAGDLPAETRQRTSIVLGKGTYLNGGNAIAVQRGLVLGQTIELLRRLHPEHSDAELAQIRSELEGTLPSLVPDTVPGLIPNIIVGRIANRLDLMGPAYTVDAACASSLVAVGHAVRDLLSGDSDLALAGGSQVWMPVATLNLFCRLGALSRRERLQPFDKDADGTLLGEGIGFVVLKRTADAVRDGDRVYAVIRSVGIASDGRGMSVMAPRTEGEELALRRAYEAAGVSPRSVGLIEAHGTGTPVGDVTEIRSLTRVLGERGDAPARCAIGSVKSMISHTIPAAGVAGLIKTALALHHRILPPTIGVTEPNPELQLERTPLYLNTETRPWIHGGGAPRRAGVNAFGFGGINAHAVLEEFGGDARDSAAPSHRPPWDTELILLAADSPAALAERARELAGALEGTVARPALADLAATLADEASPPDGKASGAPAGHRLAIVASSIDDLLAKLGQAAGKLGQPDCRRIRTMSGIYYEAEPLGRGGKVVFVFPGEGAQYPEMLSELCMQFPEARAVFDRIDRLYAGHPRGHVLSDWVFPPPAFSEDERRRTEDRLMELDIAVESVLTANAAVHAVMRRLVPDVDALVGHSTGEHSAAMAAGVLDLDTDERLATFCLGLNASYADAAARHAVPGAVLLALGTDAAGARRIAEAAETADGELYLAMDNCPHQVVLVGEAQAAGRAREIAAAEGIVCEQLPYDRAVHTPLFAPIAQDLRATFAKLPVRGSSAQLWSCTTAAPCPADPAEIRELLVEHWTSPVRFRETIEALHDDGARVFVEVGPRGNLTTFVTDILRGRPAVAVAADLRRRPGVTQLNHATALLAAHHVPLELDCLFTGRVSGDVDWRRPAPPPDHGGAGAPIALSTGWPMMRLSDAALARVRALSPPVEPRADGHAPAPTLAPAAPTPAPAAPTLAPAAPTPAPPAAAPIPLAAAGEAAVALDGHLQTMERFLRTSGDVLHACLGGSVVTARPLPLVGEIAAHEPGASLVARRVVDRRTDRYLLDHALGWTVSRTDPELAALTLMPLAMSLELLAEAAATLLPGYLVVGLRDVCAHRWLEVGEAPTELALVAQRLPDGGGPHHVRVQLHDADRGSGPAVEGTVLLHDTFAPAPSPAPSPTPDGRPLRRPTGALYGEAMFHGPLWQGVDAVDAVGLAGATARLRVLPRGGMLAGDPDPAFVLDPAVLDAAGQVVGFWAVDRLDRGRVVFPTGLRALDLHGPRPSEGEILPCTAAIALDGEQRTRSDIEVRRADGRVWMRLTGWEDQRFDVPPALAPLAVPQRLAALSRPLAPPPPAGGPGLPSGVALRRVDAAVGADSALWTRAWSARVLGRRERDRFAGLPAPAGRRAEWLAARTAAKEALADLLRVAGAPEPLPAEIEILADADGRPAVDLGPFAAHAPAGTVPVISLAHSAGRAVAAAVLVRADAPAGIGIDVELRGPRPAGFDRASLRDGERALLAGVPADDRDEWLLRCWCAREAAGKATGTGALGAGAPALTEIDPIAGTVGATAGGHRLAVRTWCDGELVAALTWFGEPWND